MVFADIVDAVGGNSVAARSALKKDRERGRVVFKGGKYGLKPQKPGPVKTSAPPA